MSILMPWSLLVCAFAASPPDAAHLAAHADPGRIYRMVEAVTGPDCEGRLAGSEGYLKAAGKVAAALRASGVKPLAPDYLQGFPSPWTRVRRLSLSATGPEGRPLEAVLFRDYAPMLFCGSGQAESEVVFAGFGMTSPKLGWDDYAGLDVQGKVVMVLRGTPEARTGEDWTEVNSHRHRAENARRRGAAGLLYIYLPVANPNGEYLPGFPMAMVGEGFAERLLAASGLDLKTLKGLLARRLPASLATGTRVRLETETDHMPQGRTANVVGWIPGSDPALRGEAVVLGAHLDHCGAWPVLMPGADDDASGVAAVVEAARLLASSPVKPKRSIVFLVSSGEEQGMVGAKHFLANPPREIRRFRFMTFLDVMGAGDGVHVYGLKAEPGREAALRAMHRDLGLSMRLEGDAQKKVNNGDHGPFQDRDIPAVAIFGTGPHPTYHTDRDDLFRFTPRLALEAAQLAALLTLRTANE